MIDPALLQLASTIGSLVTTGISIASKLGQRDGFIAALDGAFAAARARTDADLDAKHAHAGPTPGQVAFEAYSARRGGKNHDGTPTPLWAALGEGVRDGWEAAALAARAT